MVNDKMVVAVGADDLLVRVDPDRHSELTGRPGAAQAEMGAGRSMGPGWISVAEETRTNDDLQFWPSVGAGVQRGRNSLTDAAVDALAQQVGVPAVPRVLLDPVHQQLPDGDVVLSQPFAQIRMLGDRGVGLRLLAGKIGVRRLDHALIGDGSVEVPVAVAVQLRQLVGR